MARESQLAYEAKPPAYATEIMDVYGSRGFIAQNQFGTVVSIKGTDSWADFRADATIRKDIFLGHYGVHSGFLGRFDQIWKQIASTNFIEPVWVTGHSLGGALATLVAFALRRVCGIMPYVATFGSPRVGNAAFARAYNEFVPYTTRVVHSLDLVPRAPKFGYEHVNKLLHLDLDGHILGPVRTFLKHLLEFGEVILSDLSGEALSNHHIGSYVGALIRLNYRLGGDAR
jgi:hypothetical protein